MARNRFSRDSVALSVQWERVFFQPVYTLSLKAGLRSDRTFPLLTPRYLTGQTPHKMLNYYSVVPTAV